MAETAETAETTWQASLFGVAEPAVDTSFASVDRIALDDESWIEHAPRWLDGADEVFAALLEAGDWQTQTRRMYDKVVDQPRLTASWRTGAIRDRVPVIEEARRALSDRYAVELDTGGLNLYRDGRDSVAWHVDRIPKSIDRPVVAIVSVGEPRRFLVRPRGGGKSRRFELGGGDLLVTGGLAQRRWEHSVPKVASAGPRISITFRHSENPQAGESTSA